MDDELTEPNEDELPPKPPIDERLATDEELEAEDLPGDQELTENDFMPEQVAEELSTVDDRESDD